MFQARNAEYNPKRFAAVIMRIREPKTTALIFASGKMVVTGAKSEDDSKLASRKYARIIQKLGFNAYVTRQAHLLMGDADFVAGNSQTSRSRTSSALAISSSLSAWRVLLAAITCSHPTNPNFSQV